MKLANTWRRPNTVVEKLGKVTYKLKDKDVKIMDTPAHASNLTVANGKRGQQLTAYRPWKKSNDLRHGDLREHKSDW